MFSKKNQNKTLVRILALVLAVAMILMSCFYLTYIFTGDSGLYVYADSFEGGSGSSINALSASSSPDWEYQAEGMKEFIEYIVENYADVVDPKDLINAAYSGVLESLDPWSVYYPSQEQQDEFINSVDQKYSGVGITMQEENGRCLIIDVNKSGPAFEAGITSGSYITAVDGKSCEGWNINDISSAVRGEEGTSVTLTIEKNGVKSDYKLVRKALTAATVSGQMLEDDIAYIDISSFASSTGNEFRVERLRLLNEGAKGLIIDLRNNGGGFMSSCIEIADQLLDECVITYYEHQGEIIETVYSGQSAYRKVPIVILMNEYTASASECLIGALRDNAGAKLVGHTSYGKGVAQAIVDGDDGASMKLTVFYYLTPNKEKVQGKGFTPDYAVDLYSGNSDAEISAILETLSPMDEKVKYYKGQKGLNVFGAQQRLKFMGYDVNLTAVMDDKTVEAIKQVQAGFGGCPYGGLDFSTQAAIAQNFEAWLYGSDGDAQLSKAIEVLKNEM